MHNKIIPKGSLDGELLDIETVKRREAEAIKFMKSHTVQKGSIVELVKNTLFYKKGQRAIVVNTFDSSNNNKEKMEIRYEGEQYIGNDVDVVPKKWFKLVEIL